MSTRGLTFRPGQYQILRFVIGNLYQEGVGGSGETKAGSERAKEEADPGRLHGMQVRPPCLRGAV